MCYSNDCYFGNEHYFKALKFLLVHLCILVKCHESSHERGMCAFKVVLPAHIWSLIYPPAFSPVPAARAYMFLSHPYKYNSLRTQRVLVAIAPLIFNQTAVKLLTFAVL